MADPTKFTSKQRERILDAYMKRYSDRESTGFNYDHQGLKRFAHADLSQAINAHLVSENIPTHFKELLFDIILQGKLQECAEVTLRYVLNEKEETNVRMDAI